MAMPGKPFGSLGRRSRGWLACAILAFGVPAFAIGLSKAITQVIPAALRGSVGQRFLLNISGGLVAEWFFVIALWLILRARNESFRDLGVWRSGSTGAWVLALSVAALNIGSNLRFLPRMNVPISYAFAPRGFHLVAALALGITAGCCEEVLFRGFLMKEFARAGYGRVMQVIIPGLSFGFAHLGYTVHGIGAAIGIMLPTALIGMIWGVAYLLGRRSLLPCVIAHFLNDATALPWIIFSLSGLS